MSDSGMFCPAEELWRQGSKVKLNIYDGHGTPVCQCHSEDYAELIVTAVNGLILEMAAELAQKKKQQ